MTNLTPLQKAIRLQGWGAQRRFAQELGISESDFSRIAGGHHDPDDDTKAAITDLVRRKTDFDGSVDDLFPPAAASAA
jgi:hypothetical protein